MAIGTGVGMAIAAGLSAAGTAAASKSQGTASRDASRIEQRSSQEALAAAREEQAYRRRFDEDERDYSRRVGEDDRAYKRRMDADDRLFERGRYTEERDYGRGQTANYLERLEPFRQGGTRALANLSASTSRAMPGMVPAAGGSRRVKIQAPTGQIAEVPEAHAQWYESRGGVRV